MRFYSADNFINDAYASLL